MYSTYTFPSLALHSESTGASPVNVCDLTSVERERGGKTGRGREGEGGETGRGRQGEGERERERGRERERERERGRERER